MRRIALLAFAALAACGNPDNLVVGSIPYTSNTLIGIAEVRSSISATENVTVQGQPTTRTLVVLSNASDLCNKVAAHADYFRVSYEQSTSLLLYFPGDKIGDFLAGQTNVGAGIYFGSTPADAGAPGQVLLFPGGGLGQTSVPQLGNELRGSFDWFIDAGGASHEFYGRFKTVPCPALTSATLP